MIKIRYHLTTNINLGLEDYHNAGISPERSKELIESIVEPNQHYGYSSTLKLHCTPTGINRNWSVETTAQHKDDIDYVILLIARKLDKELLENCKLNKGERNFIESRVKFPLRYG